MSAPGRKLYDAIKALFVYYHKVLKKKKNGSVDAGLYDIKEYFCGRNENGRLNTRSNDAEYNALNAEYRLCLKELATHIVPKALEYGFIDE